MTVPEECPPTALELLAECSSCGQVAWQPPVGDTPLCEVFLPGAVVRTRFPVYTCGGEPDCSGVLSTDGIPYYLMRMTLTAAFGVEVFVHWADKTAGGGGIPFFTSWRDTVEKYKG